MGERSKKDGTYVYILLIHSTEQRRRTQHCKAIILKKKKDESDTSFCGEQNSRTKTEFVTIFTAIEEWVYHKNISNHSRGMCVTFHRGKNFEIRKKVKIFTTICQAKLKQLPERYLSTWKFMFFLRAPNNQK